MKKVLIILLIAFTIFLIGCERADSGDPTQQPPDTNGQTDVDASDSPDVPGPTADPDPPGNLMDFVARNPLIFTDKDLEFLEIHLWDSEQELYDAIGEPIGKEETYEENFNSPVYYLEFEDFGFVRMEPSRESDTGDAEETEYIIGSVTLLSDKYAGPRGVRIGDGYMVVVNKFHVDDNMTGDIIDGLMYLYNYPEGTMYISGRFIYREDAEDYNDDEILYIMYNFTPFGENDEFLGVGYTLAFTLEEGRIVSIGMKKQSTNIVY